MRAKKFLVGCALAVFVRLHDIREGMNHFVLVAVHGRLFRVCSHRFERTHMYQKSDYGVVFLAVMLSCAGATQEVRAGCCRDSKFPCTPDSATAAYAECPHCSDYTPGVCTPSACSAPINDVCEAAVCSGLTQPSSPQAAGFQMPRLIAFDPRQWTGGSTPNPIYVAYRVTLEDGSGQVKYVGYPKQKSCGGVPVAELRDLPEYRIWTESAIWVSGCEIYPGRDYRIVAVRSDYRDRVTGVLTPNDPSTTSDELIVSTLSGDTTGLVDPAMCASEAGQDLERLRALPQLNKPHGAEYWGQSFLVQARSDSILRDTLKEYIRIARDAPVYVNTVLNISASNDPRLNLELIFDLIAEVNDAVPASSWPAKLAVFMRPWIHAFPAHCGTSAKTWPTNDPDAELSECGAGDEHCTELGFLHDRMSALTQWLAAYNGCRATCTQPTCSGSSVYSVPGWETFTFAFDCHPGPAIEVDLLVIESERFFTEGNRSLTSVNECDASCCGSGQTCDYGYCVSGDASCASSSCCDPTQTEWETAITRKHDAILDLVFKRRKCGSTVDLAPFFPGVLIDRYNRCGDPLYNFDEALAPNETLSKPIYDLPLFCAMESTLCNCRRRAVGDLNQTIDCDEFPDPPPITPWVSLGSAYVRCPDQLGFPTCYDWHEDHTLKASHELGRRIHFPLSLDTPPEFKSLSNLVIFWPRPFEQRIRGNFARHFAAYVRGASGQPLENDCNNNGFSDECDPDADTDGIPDACDPCTDSDADGYGDPGFLVNTCPLDNCPTVKNQNQADTDLDGMGDACDSGGNECSTAIVHAIDVPDMVGDSVVVTLAGDTTAATGPDGCEALPFQGSQPDPGWWEAFQINECAMMYIDFCTTDPPMQNMWSQLFDCPCGCPISANSPQQGFGNSSCSDGNPAAEFGPLPPGTYYFPIYAANPTQRGSYQAHITVQACPQAACCVDNNCILGTRLDCDAAGGYFQAPPNRSTATVFCLSNTCNTGACCHSDGSCYDGLPDFPIELAQCEPSSTFYGAGACNGTPSDPNQANPCLEAQACCLAGACHNLTVAHCQSLNGIPQGPSSRCEGDRNGNGTDDVCEVLVAAAASAPDPTLPKSRFITISAGEACRNQAIRVKLVNLYDPNPPPQGTLPDFSAFEGEYRWVGPPVQHVENNFPSTYAPLKCTPHFMDWSTVGPVHVYGAEIIPSSIYEVQVIDISCAEGLNIESHYSAPLTIATGKWGDVVAPFHVSGGTNQPNFQDVAAVVNNFKDAPGAPINAFAQMGPNIPNPVGNVSFLDVAAVVSSFQGKSYPYAGPSHCP
ncbi:MAG: thrombospondin type 3 repeat-containing protein [Planctomycetota bacterium]